MEEKRYDLLVDICVACGAPTVPGEQICRECQKIVGEEQMSRVGRTTSLSEKIHWWKK